MTSGSPLNIGLEFPALARNAVALSFTSRMSRSSSSEDVLPSRYPNTDSTVCPSSRSNHAGVSVWLTKVLSGTVVLFPWEGPPPFRVSDTACARASGRAGYMPTLRSTSLWKPGFSSVTRRVQAAELMNARIGMSTAQSANVVIPRAKLRLRPGISHIATKARKTAKSTCITDTSFRYFAVFMV